MLELLLYEKNGKCQIIEEVENIRKHVSNIVTIFLRILTVCSPAI